MQELDTDERVMQFLGSGRLRSEAESKANIEKNLNDYEKFDLGLYVAQSTDSNEYLGRTGLIPWTFDNELMWEVGYSFKPSVWGKGLATEAAQFLVQWGFANLPVSFLISLINPKNAASIRVATNAGMSFWKTTYINDLELATYRIDMR